MTRNEFQILRDKIERGSHGGHQLAKLSTKEAMWINKFIDIAYQDYPEWIESLIK